MIAIGQWHMVCSVQPCGATCILASVASAVMPIVSTTTSIVAAVVVRHVLIKLAHLTIVIGIRNVSALDFLVMSLTVALPVVTAMTAAAVAVVL